MLHSFSPPTASDDADGAGDESPAQRSLAQFHEQSGE